MRHHRWRPLLTLLLLITASTVSPARAQPDASPVASPAATAAWTVAESRPLAVDGNLIALSPDGKWIAGTDPMGEHVCLWEVESLDPTCQESAGEIDVRSIAWAPDSTAVAYSLDAMLGNVESDIYVVDVAAGSVTNLTDDGVDGTFRPWDGVDSLDTYPTWTRDSQHLTFVRTTHDPAAEHTATTLMTIAREGGKPKTLPWQSDQFFAISAPMTYLADGSLLFADWSVDLENPNVGWWLLSPSGEASLMLGTAKQSPFAYADIMDVWEGDGVVKVAGLASEARPFVLTLGQNEPVPLATPERDRRPLASMLFAPNGHHLLGLFDGPGGQNQAMLLGETPAAIELGTPGDVQTGVMLPNMRTNWSDANLLLIPGPFADSPLLLTMEPTG